MSSPSISQEDEDAQSDGNVAAGKPQTSNDSKSNGANDVETSEIANSEKQRPFKEDPIFVEPLTVMYQKRNILDLFENIGGARQFSRFTVLPENNLNCFFQNRAQYWRLSSAAEQADYHHEKCPCCDFFYPASTQGPKAFNKNALTDSLITFLKANEQMTVTHNTSAMNQFSSNNHYGYPMQQLSPQQRYPPANGTALALLHLMNNVSRNASNAFQSWTNFIILFIPNAISENRKKGEVFFSCVLWTVSWWHIKCTTSVYDEIWFWKISMKELKIIVLK